MQAELDAAQQLLEAAQKAAAESDARAQGLAAELAAAQKLQGAGDQGEADTQQLQRLQEQVGSNAFLQSTPLISFSYISPSHSTSHPLQRASGPT